MGADQPCCHRTINWSKHGLKPQVSQTFIDRRPRPSGAAPLSAKVISDQQQLANRFSELKIIPNSIEIKQAVWTAK